MMRCKTVLLSIFFSGNLLAQNLVPNPSFEEISRCPNSFSTTKGDFVVPGWNSPTNGTPDHFHSCSWGEADVPFNWAGSSNAHTGKAYAGMYVWNKRDDSKSYREYIQCELAEPLVSGEVYILEFYYKLAPFSVYTSNRLGMVVTAQPMVLTHDQVIETVPQLSVVKDTTDLKAIDKWERARIEYKSQGGERYLTIGNFYNNQETKFKKLPFRFGKSAMLSTSSYFYIDDVAIHLVDSLKPKPVPIPTADFKLDAFELNKDYILQNITFEFDSYILLRQSFVELDKVVEYLKQHPDVSVRLSGHTDFIGSDEYNITLSRNRAWSVGDHLITKGISSQRVISYGFGKTRPIALGKTDADRKINRRVEIRFVTTP